jgi:hypothetical protein
MSIANRKEFYKWYEQQQSIQEEEASHPPD